MLRVRFNNASGGHAHRAARQECAGSRAARALPGGPPTWEPGLLPSVKGLRARCGGRGGRLRSPLRPLSHRSGVCRPSKESVARSF